jgi:ATP/maltotriose-dependent transcriptional regulator MalT
LRGTNRHIFDYLSQEVLAAQPADVRAFLLGSSILEQMSAALCDEVLGVEDSGQILETLEAGNLFIVPLDDEREWYRYHHLFRDFLQEQLRREQGDEVGGLRRKALAYFEAAGDVERAIHHCQAAGETEKMAELVEQAAPGYLRRGRLRTVQAWLEAVPEEVATGRPWLALYQGMILSIRGQAREAWSHLSGAQRVFDKLDDELGESRALNELGRVAFLEGRYQESLELNHEALRHMPWADHEGRVQALRDQCEVWLYLGDLNRAIHAIEEALAHAQQLGDRTVLAEATIWQGSAYYHACRLPEGMRTLKRGLSMLGDPAALGAHVAHCTIGWIHLERWELEEAFDLLDQSLALSKKFQDTDYMIFAHVTMGTIHVEREAFDEAQAGFEAALAILEQTGTENMSAELVWHFVADWHAKAGRYTQAEDFSRKAIALRGEEAGGLAWGMGWLPLARVYLATGRLDEAEGILLDVEAASETGGTRNGWYILVSDRQRRPSGALVSGKGPGGRSNGPHHKGPPGSRDRGAPLDVPQPARGGSAALDPRPKAQDRARLCARPAARVGRGGRARAERTARPRRPRGTSLRRGAATGRIPPAPGDDGRHRVA